MLHKTWDISYILYGPQLNLQDKWMGLKYTRFSFYLITLKGSERTSSFYHFRLHVSMMGRLDVPFPYLEEYVITSVKGMLSGCHDPMLQNIFM